MIRKTPGRRRRDNSQLNRVRRGHFASAGSTAANRSLDGMKACRGLLSRRRRCHWPLHESSGHQKIHSAQYPSTSGNRGRTTPNQVVARRCRVTLLLTGCHRHLRPGNSPTGHVQNPGRWSQTVRAKVRSTPGHRWCYRPVG